MSENLNARGHGVVMQPDDGPTFWQPLPANGHTEPKLVPANTHFDGVSMGYQTIAPQGRVREHSHGEQIEMLVPQHRGRLADFTGDEFLAEFPTALDGVVDTSVHIWEIERAPVGPDRLREGLSIAG